MSRFWRILPVLFTVLGLCTHLASAQTPELKLTLSRDWGYGGLAGDIQGLFTMHVAGPADLVAVDFYIDDQLIGQDTVAPWGLQFNTDQYSLGQHTLSARGHTSDGAELTSNILTRQFVPETQSWKTALMIAVPVLALAVLFPLVTYLIDRRRGGGKRSGYGAWGAAVCPKCGHPFSLHWWAPNLASAKFDRCPHCGKWSTVSRATSAQLAAAEALWSEDAAASEPQPELSSEEKLRRQLDDSRYQDS